MNWKAEWKKLAAIAVVFAALFWLPVGGERFRSAVLESLHLAKWYAREHVLLCLVPAFFIAGAIGVFVSQAAVMKYLGPRANKVLAYGVASVSGSVLAVCSCTVLPLFAGIWRMGAGLGPAVAFLYSGPAINILAIILTARILGLEIGIARAVGAIVFSIVIGLLMHLFFRKEELEKANSRAGMPEPEVARPLWQNALFFAVMIGVLVFANLGAPNDWHFRLDNGREFEAAIVKDADGADGDSAEYTLKLLRGPDKGKELQVSASAIVEKTPASGLWTALWQWKWNIAAMFAVAFGVILVLWFRIAWWKVVIAGVPPAILAFAMPTGGVFVLIPFSAAIVGLSIITSTEEGEAGDWFAATWGFTKQILPLLFLGVLVAGFLLGRPDHEGIIPGRYVQMLVGDKPDTFLEMTGLLGGPAESLIRPFWSLWTNFFASIFGAFMYFATLTEVPILKGLLGAGMGKGPALALLLAGPALSLPNMLVIRSVLGTRKTVVFVTLVVVMATISGLIFGSIV
ncbi:MAG: permease [Planctomycetes bacterium]|nr:permease [Planctomycetota bacterium]